ncbi:dipeptidylpeptidase [Gaertneriomyces sp. JEL0708]|nr:dipeptidylpeptidase [Gaertneriomyces sp. JEL0708]
MLYLRTDLSRVEKVYLPTATAGVGHEKGHESDGEGRVHYYPKAGTANATSVLEVVEFAEDMKVRRRLRCDLKAWFDWIEYLPRVGWVDGYDGVWVWGLDRAQERGVIILVPLESFQECKEHEGTGDVDTNTTEKQVFVLYEEQTSHWITATDCISLWFSSKASITGTLHPQTHDREIRFTFTSDCTGFRHLYIGTFDPFAPTQSVPSTSVIRNGKAYTTVYPQTTVTPLTSGPYTVMDSPIYVDADRGWVYTHARWDVGETGVFRVDYPRKPQAVGVDAGCDGGLVRLTKRGISHHFTFQPLPQLEGGNSELMVVDQWSHLSEYGIHILTLTDAPPPSSSSLSIPAASDYKHAVNGAKLVCQIQPAQWKSFTALCRAKEALNELIPLSKPKVFRFRNSAGLLIYGCFYPATTSTTTCTQPPQPPSSPLSAHRGAPTILQMYGGPTISTITNTYTYPRHARVALWNSLGLNVVLVDNRGTSERGREFEHGVKYQKRTAHNGEGETRGGLGTVEIRDWIETLVFLVHGAGTHSPFSSSSGGDHQVGRNDWPYNEDDSDPIFDIRSLHITPDTDLLPFLTPASHNDDRISHTGIDVTRVYTLGWSYGGFLSLLMYLKYPALIRKSVAGAPVCDWRWYDAGYTERYLGIPATPHSDMSADSEEPYTRASVIDVLKSEDVRKGLMVRRRETEESGAESLLFVHGKRDDNVLWKGVEGVVGELERVCLVKREGECEPGKSDSVRERDANQEGTVGDERDRFFKLMLYETEGHGLRSRKTVEEFEVCVARIFECT